MANKELRARVKLDVRDAEAKLKRLTTLINSLNRSTRDVAKANSGITKAVAQYDKLVRTQQRSVKALGEGDKAAKRIAESAKKAKHAEYERWWQETLITQELNKQNATLTKSTSKLTQITNKAREWRTAMSSGLQSFNESINKSGSLLGGVWGKLKGIAATYLGLMGTRALVNTSDIITSAENKLNYVNAQSLGSAGMNGDGSYSSATLNATQESMDKMYASSQKVRMSYTDMMANVSKSMALAGDAFQHSTDNAIRFQEIMAEGYAVGGASAEEMSTSMYQLIQALGSGQLAGDELRSVREGAPLIYKEIEKRVQDLMATSEATKKYATQSLKDIAAEGLVTADMVVDAVMRAGDKMDNAFAQTKQTFAQTWDQIKNAAVRAFQPLANLLNDALNKAVENGMIDKIETAFVNISKALQIAFKIIANSIAWIANNWNWLQHVIIAGIILMITWTVIKAGVAVACALMELRAWLAANAALLPTIAIIATIIAGLLALIYVFYLWKTGAIDTCSAIITALLIVGAVVMIIGLLIGSWVVVLVGAIIAAIAGIIYYLDYFLGVVYGVGAAIYNIVMGVLDGIIQSFWSIFVDPIKGIIEWFVNAWNGAFDGVGGAFANLCGQLLSGLIGLVKPFAKLLDKIFGWDTNGAIESAQASMKSWGKTDSAVTYSVEAPTAASLLNKLGLNLPERISYADAWDKGMEHGAAGKEWLSNLWSESQTGFGDFSLDDIGKKLGLDLNDSANGGKFPSASDPAYGAGGAYGYPSADDLLGGIDGLNDSVDGIADSLDLTEEDLSYLRKIAEMEWKKEYTTATITVDMSNYNTVNGDGDLDGIVTKLADKLYEEMDYLANGVYA